MEDPTTELPAAGDDSTTRLEQARGRRTDPRSGRERTDPRSGRERRIGPYRLLDRLGEGGMGVVHRAIGPNGGEVAIKVLRPHVAYDEKARERLRREVSSLTRVRAAGVAGVLDADTDGEQPYLVTEYVPGPPLDDVVEERGPLDPEQLATLGRGLAEALREIHAVGVVHRDLKPGNVLMVGDRPVLIDFGIAHIGDDSRLTQTGLVMGTPGYLSPEIVDGADVGPATDWWGWAATLAFAASGRAPFGKGPMPVILDRVARGQADLSGVDPRIRPLLEAALSPEPQRRPSADEVLRELDVFARGGMTGAIVARRAARPGTTPIGRSAPAARPGAPGSAIDAAGGQPLHHKNAPVRPQQPRTERIDPRGSSAGSQVAPQVPQQWVADPSAVQAAAPARDPRIGQPARTWTLTCLALAVTGLSMLAPIVAWFAALAWIFAARWNDKATTAMVLRRYAAGHRKSDRAVAMALSPWHALQAALSTLLAAIIPVFLGAVTVVVVAFGSNFAGIASATYGRPLAIGAGTLVALWSAWWGVGGTATRRGSRSLVRTLAPNRQITLGVVIGLLVMAVLCILVAAGRLDEPLSWWPYTDSTQVPGSGIIPGIPASWR